MATFYSAVAADVKMALRVTETSTDVNSNCELGVDRLACRFELVLQQLT